MTVRLAVVVTVTLLGLMTFLLLFLQVGYYTYSTSGTGYLLCGLANRICGAVLATEETGCLFFFLVSDGLL